MFLCSFTIILADSLKGKGIICEFSRHLSLEHYWLTSGIPWWFSGYHSVRSLPLGGVHIHTHTHTHRLTSLSFSKLCTSATLYSFIYCSSFILGFPDTLWRNYLCSFPLLHSVLFSSVQSLSCVWLFATPWIAARQASLSITNSGSSLKLTSIESVMPSSHLIFCCPLFLLPPIPPSIRVFSRNESTLCMRWPKYWSFSFSIILSKEHPGLNSFRMDWLDLLAVQGTLKSLLQHHSSKASILQRSAFFTVQLSHPYMTTGRTIALTRRTFVGKVMSRLCFSICYLGWS